MKTRFDIHKIEPNAYKGMMELEQYIASTGMNKTLKELIKIRASQMNGCAYCIELHTADALKNGEDQQRIFALSAWWESPLFTDE